MTDEDTRRMCLALEALAREERRRVGWVFAGAAGLMIGLAAGATAVVWLLPCV